MIILDTNVLYRLADIEKDKDLDLEKLKLYLKDKKCCCSLYTVFEILKSKFLKTEKEKVYRYLKRNNIMINSNENINKKIYKFLLEGNNNIKEKILDFYGEEVIKEITPNIQFFIICYAYMSATIFLDNYEKNLSEGKKYFRTNFVLIQKKIDKYIFKLIEKKLYLLLYSKNFNANNIQQMLILMAKNLMIYYYEILKQAKILFEGKNPYAYYKIINLFKKLSKQILKDPLNKEIEFDREYLSVCYIIFLKIRDDEFFKNWSKKQIEDYIQSKIQNSIYFENGMDNEFEQQWLTKMINSLYIQSAKLKPNDFLDYEILKDFYYNSEYNILITFDKGMQKIMSNIKSSNKFMESIKIIKGFYI